MTSAGMLCLLAVVDSASVPPAQGVVPGIQDNSFLLEEAYNQEEGVVQHISTFSRSWRPGDWVYSFTQEWPLGGIDHQISFTLPVADLHDGPAANLGIGDVALNYRYQFLGSGDARVAVAPRLTLLLPTGRDGRGGGAVGLQLNLPVSAALSGRIVTHYNAGLTHTSSAQSTTGDRADTTSYNLGASVNWVATPRLHFLLEACWAREETVLAAGRTAAQTTLLVSPGIRWSHNLPGGRQVVPGIAFPIALGPGEGGVFLYLSFEHPFRSRAGSR